MKIYYYLYQITNKCNGKIYVGVHKTSDLDDGYMGSGKVLKRAQEKYGIENFEKEILGTFDSAEAMFEAESRLVNEEFVARDDTYNIKLGGQGGWDYVNINCGNQGERLNRALTNEKRSLGHKSRMKHCREDPEFDRKYRQALSDAAKLSLGFNGHSHSEEAKINIGKANSKHQKGKGNSQFGTIWIYNETLKESRKIPKTDPIPDGWKRGRKMKF